MVMAFIVVMGVLIYTWLVYPGVVLWLGRRVAAHSAPPAAEAKPLPVIAILFSAHNEESVILQRLENLAALDYPADRLIVLAGIDGGSDRTAEIALAWARSHPTVHVVVSPENHGKTAMLKRLVERGELLGCSVDKLLSESPEGSLSSATKQLNNLTTPLPSLPLLVFTDANTFFAPDALRRLVAPFADPAVGGVCGRLVFLPPKGAGELLGCSVDKLLSESPASPGELLGCSVDKLLSESPAGSLLLASTTEQPNNLTTSRASGSLSSTTKQPGNSTTVSSAGTGGTDESSYWNLETRLKGAESALDSCLGANGAIYAIRAGLFPAHFPDNTIIDDFVIGMKVREQGQRLVYEPAAVATEELPATVEAEWRRRVRIGAGAYQALALCWRCLLPRYGVFAWMFWSHKVLRWFTPHLLVAGGGLLSCLVVRLLSQDAEAPPSSASQQLSNLTTGFLLLLALVSAVWLSKRGRKGLKLLGYFLTMQAALFAGFLRFCKGNLRGTWNRTER
jgi:cellulose synthase/poly-beta-1,6-N-acetylglucosamine synthase-like glycosyltransferase